MQIFFKTAKNGLWELTGKQFKTTHNVSDIGVPLERAKRMVSGKDSITCEIEFRGLQLIY